MTDEQGGSNTSLYVKERVSALLKHRETECTVILARAYIEILKKLNGDVGTAFRLFNEFTRTVADAPVPQRRRGKANRKLDARILAAGDTAPRGQREAAVAEAAGAKTTKQVDAARKRYDRLRADRDTHNKWVAEMVSVVRRKLRLSSPQPLFRSTSLAPPQQALDGDKYPR